MRTQKPRNKRLHKKMPHLRQKVQKRKRRVLLKKLLKLRLPKALRLPLKQRANPQATSPSWGPVVVL
jgi:hypothetical protein